ncbi:Uma2 family endonuclease [Spirillospora sp. NPDC127200]
MSMPVWAADPKSLLLTAARYAELPDHVRRSVEVVDNHVVFLHSGNVEHSRVARRLAEAIERARPDTPCIAVSTEVDMHYRRFHRNADGDWLSFRRPDVTVHRCLARGTDLTSGDALVVVEVVSPGSEQADTVQKVAEYAKEQIPVYLVVTLDDDLHVKFVREYRLDWSRTNYQLVGVHEGELSLTDPVAFTALFTDLDRA